MKIEVSRSADGFPKVAWIQETSESGDTVGSRVKKWLMVLGLAGGFLWGWQANDARLMLVGPLAGLIAVMALGGMVEKEKGPSPDDEEPILEKQYCEACIVRRNGVLMFSWSLKGKRMTGSFEIPLAEATELVVGGFNEWFGAKSGRRFHESLVIIMPMRDGHVLRLADHAGHQREIAELHAVLSQNFIEPRDALLRRDEAEKRARQGAGSQSGVPDSL
jgi:hypothetical protein